MSQVRRLKIVKIAIASFFVVLMYAGLQGRQHARLHARVEDVTVVRDQLQRKLDGEERLAEQSVQVTAIISALKARLRQFDADHDPRKLPGTEGLEIRLSNATLANAEQRFADALATITDEDEKAKDAVRVLQVRADAFYGLREWQNALDRYQRMLILQPHRMVTLRRVADCQYALGRVNEAFATYAELAKAHKHRGDDLRIQGKPNAAKVHDEQAAQIEARLEQERQKALPPKAE